MNPWTPLVVATLGWGSAAVLTRALLTHGVSTFVVVPMRFGIALVILALVSRRWRRFGGVDRAQWGRGIVLGVVAVSAPNILFTLGLEDLPVGLGGLLVALIPIATVAGAHFLVEGERFDPGSVPGLVISLIGTGVLVGWGGTTIDGVGDLWRGVGLSLVAVLFAGLGGALTRRFALQVGGDGLVLPQFAGAFVVCLVLALVVDPGRLDTIAAGDWGLLLGLGVVATAMPFTSFLIGAEVNPASRLAVVSYLVPVIAVVLAVVFLGESLNAAVVIGAALIIGGVVLTERTSRHVPVAGVNTAR